MLRSLLAVGLLANLPLPDGSWVGTLAQVTLVCVIAALLGGTKDLRARDRHVPRERAEPLAA